MVVMVLSTVASWFEKLAWLSNPEDIDPRNCGLLVNNRILVMRTAEGPVGTFGAAMEAKIGLLIPRG
jgi:hypothetical protein